MPPWRTMCRTDDLRAADLWSNKDQRYVDVTVVIVDVKEGDAQGENGKKSTRPFAYFARHAWLAQKPFKLCSTDGMTIESMLGTNITERWKGTAITLFVTKVRSPKNGMVDAIRVRPQLPAQPDPKRGAELEAAKKQRGEEAGFSKFLENAPLGMSEEEAREIYAREAKENR